jgi:hypothetical protein
MANSGAFPGANPSGNYKLPRMHVMQAGQDSDTTQGLSVGGRYLQNKRRMTQWTSTEIQVRDVATQNVFRSPSPADEDM